MLKRDMIQQNLQISCVSCFLFLSYHAKADYNMIFPNPRNHYHLITPPLNWMWSPHLVLQTSLGWNTKEIKFHLPTHEFDGSGGNTNYSYYLCDSGQGRSEDVGSCGNDVNFTCCKWLYIRLMEDLRRSHKKKLYDCDAADFFSIFGTLLTPAYHGMSYMESLVPYLYTDEASILYIVRIVYEPNLDVLKVVGGSKEEDEKMMLKKNR